MIEMRVNNETSIDLVERALGHSSASFESGTRDSCWAAKRDTTSEVMRVQRTKKNSQKLTARQKW